VTTPALDADARLEIAEVLVRYATGIDQRDWDLFRTCFTPDCHADYGDIGVWDGIDELTAWMDSAHQGAGHTLHRISNPTIAPAEAIAPEEPRATARCYVDAIVMGADNLSGVRAVGFYDDELVRTNQGWQIRRRRFTPAIFQGIGLGATS
jgi:3-phenylpropionate/cinnamic acid dioxygenase small subunit